VYFQYIEAYVADLKEIYSMNCWPCEGLDLWGGLEHNIRQPRTLEERLEAKKRKLRPWGGIYALTWPKIGEKPQLKVWRNNRYIYITFPSIHIQHQQIKSPYLYYYSAINDEEHPELDVTQFIPDSSPWYLQYLDEEYESIKRNHYYNFE
jgi:hypothetical protein